MSRVISTGGVSAIVTTLFSTALLAYYFITRNFSYAKDYVKVGRVQKLVVHPIKSCKGVEVDQITVTKTGVKHGQFRDRGWVVLDKEGKMLNLMRVPQLITITTSFEGDRYLVLRNKFDETIKIEVRTSFTESDRIFNTK